MGKPYTHTHKSKVNSRDGVGTVVIAGDDEDVHYGAVRMLLLAWQRSFHLHSLAHWERNDLVVGVYNYFNC